MTLYVPAHCSKCGHAFSVDGSLPAPDLMTYCPLCAIDINHTITKHLMQETGRLRGSVRIVNGARVGEPHGDRDSKN